MLAAGGSVVVAQTTTPPVGETPFLQKWLSSGHADAAAEAFVHWNNDNPPQVPADCARCHSAAGFLDFVGQDGTATGVVDKPAPVGTVVNCITCHNDAARVMTKVTFPSGVEVSDLGSSARCMQCHQGRASTAQVNQAIERAALKDSPDTANPNLRFVNIHYFAAAATLLGSETEGGYQYEGKQYQPRFQHVEGYTTCTNCHDPHSLSIKVTECAGCHKGVASAADLKNIRMKGSASDYDGDGNVTEGISFEIQGLQEMLLKAIQAYARDVAGKPIAYSAASYPYFFQDTNGNGTVDQDERSAYNAFTPRLLQAAYNYQISVKDPGAFAHNAKYVIELLYDSIASLNEKLSSPVDLSKAARDDAGHFLAIGEPFRHWDAEGEVPADCAKCHTAGGLPFRLKNGVNIASHPSDALMCSTCHSSTQTFALRQSSEVAFPSGAKLAFADSPASNLCIQCHQGRESTVSVNNAIQRANVGPNQVSSQLGFRNVHYFAAGATLFGSEAQGAYQYSGKQYRGRFAHVSSFDTCAECHDAHALNVKVDQCATCHSGVKTQADLRNIRFGSGADYDGDGNSSEGIAGEIATMHDKLLAAIQRYAANTLGTPIVYDSHSYPYWFIDSNGNGSADPEETKAGNRYAKWTPTLVRATYNYQYVAKDPGAFAHNNDYILQVLYDSLQDVGGTGAVAGMTRP